VQLTIHLHLMPMLRVSGAASYFCLQVFTVFKRNNYVVHLFYDHIAITNTADLYLDTKTFTTGGRICRVCTKTESIYLTHILFTFV
jgi:hypothetical protein